MAEALYGGPLLVRVDEFGVTIGGTTPGPAGVSAYTFADSTRYEVDHAQPRVLCELSADDPAAALAGPTVEQCVGFDRLPALEHIIGAPGPRPRRLAPLVNPPGRAVSPRANSDEATLAGRAVVLIDLAHAEELPPLAQLAAAVELVAVGDQHEDRPMFAELATAAGHRAALLADALPPSGLDSLARDDPSTARQLAAVLGRVLWRVDPDSPSPLRELDVALRHAIERARHQPQVGHADAAMAEPAAAAYGYRDLAAPPGRADADVLDLEAERDERAKRRFAAVIVGGTRLQVTLREPVAVDRRWVRILRRDGLVMLAMVPVGNTGIVDRAESPVPPGTDIGALVIEIVEHPVPARVPDRPEQLRRAIQLGRRACRRERLGDRYTARRAWRECAAMWLELGDTDRAAAATRYGDASFAGTRGDDPFIADHLAG